MVRAQRTAGLTVLIGILLLTATPMASVAGGPSAQVDTNASVSRSPGTQFAGAVATESVVLENEHHRRALNVTLSRARTPGGRAAVITERETALDRRLDALEARFARLDHARRIGRIDRDRYRAQSGVLVAAVDGIERRIGILHEALARLPDRQATRTLENDLDRLAERARTVGRADGDTGRTTDSDERDATDDDRGSSDDSADEDDGEDENTSGTERDAISTGLIDGRKHR